MVLFYTVALDSSSIHMALVVTSDYNFQISTIAFILPDLPSLNPSAILLKEVFLFQKLRYGGMRKLVFRVQRHQTAALKF